jgi:riboflavin kinase / FMN adenylyltransferase
MRPQRSKVCGAIGFFDGVHLGHQQVIRQTITIARQHEAIALVVTFDRHPNTVVAPDRVPPLIYSLPQKLRTIASLGADKLLLLHFDKALSEQAGEKFIQDLVRDLGQVQCLCVGAHFVFGHKRGGNIELLKKLGAELHFAVHGMSAVALDGEAVSSTRIRAAIRDGHLDAASQMLGRAYSLAGKVVRGDGVGKELGFPTANLDVTCLALPPGGVYAVHAQIKEEVFRGVLNIGFRPTLGKANPQLRVEVHLLGFERDVYDEEVEITFVDKLRDERKFPTLEALRAQIRQDIEDAQARF